MSKQYTLDKVDNLFGVIKTNYKTFDENGNTQYHVLRLEWHGVGKNGGAIRRAETSLNVGDPRLEEFTGKEIYQKIKQALGQTAANKLKNLYIDLINEDTSL